ncbi:MAG: isochorismatase family protein [Parvularculaceae bacterium]
MTTTLDVTSSQKSTGGALSMDDILATIYKPMETPPAPSTANAALLLIDIQQLSEPSYLKEKALAAGLEEKAIDASLADYAKRFDAAVSNCASLLSAARKAGIPAIHVKIQALNCAGRDTSALHRRMGWRFPPGAKGTKFVERTAPIKNEIIITKTASGAFTGTSLDSTLRNMGIDYLFVCGFMTDECVETSARQALDLGYLTLVASDATTTYQSRFYENTVAKFGGYEIYVAEDGCYLDGKRYSSLSAAAFAITGVKRNGPAFFGLRSSRVAP